MNRRHFLSLVSSAAALACGGMPAFAQQPARAGRLLVLVHLEGGNDAYNTLVPFDDPLYRKLRPTIAVPRDQVLQLSSTRGFHPALKPLMPAWEARELALIQGIGQEQVQDQHFRDVETQYTGAGPDQYLTDGWLTRAMPGNAGAAGQLHGLAFGDLDIREADPMGPFRGDRLRVVSVQHPGDWLATRRLSKMRYRATTPARALADQFAQPEMTELRTNFPADEFGQALKATVLLAAAGIAPPVVHITLNADSGDHHHAFDTHWKQLDYHGAALARLATGLAAFRDGMREIGRWDDTLIATYDEFGRSPKENEEFGTHHGWSSVQMVAGGKVKGGMIGAPLPVIDVFSIGGAKPAIDYRALYTTFIESWWTGSARGVFERSFKPLDLIRT